MAPRPFVIFQKISPSVSFATLSDVQSAGFGGGSAAAAGPSPFPPGPWHVTQFVSTIVFAFPMPFTGFFRFFASGGATHGSCADADCDDEGNSRDDGGHRLPEHAHSASFWTPDRHEVHGATAAI